ncbi:MAG TPA: hypothetical protein VN133_10020 [Humibacter sp.]|nr:hypothetical protein [Humibacter sp.]
MIQKIQETAKGIAALVGALLTAGSTLIPATWAIPNKPQSAASPQQVQSGTDSPTTAQP